MERTTPLTASCSLFLALALGAAAQPAKVVSRPEVPDGTASSGPRQAVEWNGALYFVASHPLTGYELWRFDGGGEPALVTDLCPGREGSEPTELTVFDGGLYFAARADCDSGSTVLYTAFGPAGAVVPVASPGDSRSRRIRRLAATSRHLYAIRQDGAEASLMVLRGSSLVKLASRASAPTPVGDRLFFIGHDEKGQELWVSDGTEAGTRRVRDIAPGAVSSIGGVDPLFAHEGVVYFVARDAARCGFWRSDGTADGTWEIADLPDAPDCGPTGEVVAVHDVFLFFASSEEGYRLWRSDGTPGGTGPLGPAGSSVWLGTSGSPALVTADRKAFFVHRLANFTSQLWVSDGTAFGTQQVFGVGDVNGMTAFRDRVLFTAENLRVAAPSRRLQLWASDGTDAGTVPLGNVLGTTYWAPFGDEMAFTGIEGSDAELWTTDGTLEGTRLAFDLVQPSPALDPAPILRTGNSQDAGVVFLGAGRLWSATAGGMIPLTAPGEEPKEPVLAGGQAFFTSGSNVLRVGKEAGSVDLLYSSDCESVRLTTDGEAVYFVDFPDTEQEFVLFKSDGGAAERVAAVPRLGFVPDLEPPPPCGRTYLASRLGDEAVLSSTGQLVATDGTEAGTRLLFPETCGDFSCILGDMAAVGDDLYLLASKESRPQLWRTRDGVSPEVLADFAELGFPEDVGRFLIRGRLTVWGDAVVFAVETAADGEELWIADADGARRLADLVPGPRGSRPRQLTPQGERLFFTAADETAGRELWMVDGGGVHRLTDLRQGPMPAFPGEVEPAGFPGFPSPHILATAGERLLFAADDGVHGAELWTSDGTAEGTRLVQDLVPGPRGSSPRDFVVAGDDVFWNAGNHDGGFELWTMPLSALEDSEPEPGPPEEPTCPTDTACLKDGRFTVTVEFRNQHASPAVDGVGRPLPQSEETALFWFFQETNVELIVKVLDGRRSNGHFWVFYGGLSDVEYRITVTDTKTGAQRLYHNPPGRVCGEGDTRAFPADSPP